MRTEVCKISGAPGNNNLCVQNDNRKLTCCNAVGVSNLHPDCELE